MLFSFIHLFWALFCTVEIVVSLWLIKKYNVSLDKLLGISCWICLVCAIVKVLCLTTMVPSADGSKFYPYYSDGDFPFYMCSLQIAGILFCKFTVNERNRKCILAYMYPTCILGAVASIVIPTILSGSPVSFLKIITDPMPYEFFSFHSLLFVIGYTIYKQVDLKPKDFISTMYILFALGFGSIVLNSAMAERVYVNGTLQSIDHVASYFFTMTTANGSSLNPKAVWLRYFGLISLAAIAVITALYIPVFVRANKEKAK